MIPIIPLLGSALVGGGAWILYKYSKLSPAERLKADAEAWELAQELALKQFNTEIEKLEKRLQKQLIIEARKQIIS